GLRSMTASLVWAKQTDRSGDTHTSCASGPRWTRGLSIASARSGIARPRRLRSTTPAMPHTADYFVDQTIPLVAHVVGRVLRHGDARCLADAAAFVGEVISSVRALLRATTSPGGTN